MLLEWGSVSHARTSLPAPGCLEPAHAAARRVVADAWRTPVPAHAGTGAPLAASAAYRCEEEGDVP